MTITPSGPKWRGYLTVGVLKREALDQGLASCFDGPSLPPLEVEPGRIFVVSGFGRKSLEVWNESRTRVQLDRECHPIEYANEPLSYQQLANLQNEPVRIAGGYQLLVAQSFEGSQLTFQTEFGGGELGIPPSELPLPGELLPPDRDYLDGGLDCNKVLRSVNGAGGPALRITGDLGVLVEDHPYLSRIVVAVNGEALTTCPDFPVAEPVECVPPRSDYCGEASGDPANCPPGPPNTRAGYFTDQVFPTPPAIATGSNEIVRQESFGIKPAGTCRYRREQQQWVLLVSTLSDNYECPQPAFIGYEGQEVLVRGRVLPADPITIIRNPYFASSLTHWSGGPGRVTGQTTFGGLPYAVITAGHRLEQSAIPLLAGSYVLQFDLDGLGDVRIQLLSNGQVAWGTLRTIATSTDEFVSDTFAVATGNYDLIIEPVTQSLSVTRFALVRQ